MSGKLRVVVPVKRVVDAAIKPRVNKANTGIETQGVKYAINPFCDIALEEALRLREKHKGLVENIHVVSIGGKKAKDILRTGLAKGADDSTLVDVGEKDVETLAVAKLLRNIVVEKKANLVLLGKQSIDKDANHTGQMLAGLLGWAQATNAARVDLDGDTLTVEREIDGGTETVKAKLPMVVTSDLRLNEPRYARLPDIMKAKKKPLAETTAEKLGVDITPRLEVLKVEEPPARAAGVVFKTVDEFVAALKEKKVVDV